MSTRAARAVGSRAPAEGGADSARRPRAFLADTAFQAGVYERPQARPPAPIFSLQETEDSRAEAVSPTRLRPPSAKVLAVHATELVRPIRITPKVHTQPVAVRRTLPVWVFNP